jgi:Flp pilus assembly protein TadD
MRTALRATAVTILLVGTSWLGLASLRSDRENMSAPVAIAALPASCQVDDWLVAARDAAYQQRWHTVLALVTRAADECGRNADRYHLAVLANLHLDKMFEAIAAAVRLTDEAPTQPSAWRLRCHVLEHFGRWAEARSACMRADELDVEFTGATALAP